MSRKSVAAFGSKSAAARAMFKSGSTVSAVAAEIGIGYAFAYGIAKRAGYAATAANRRPTRTVETRPDGSVSVRTANGTVTVRPDGTVRRTRG
jgi:hypothetical protein